VGPVSLDYVNEDEGFVVEGMWNGGRVHLVFARDSLRGTVAANSLFYSKTNPQSGEVMEPFRNRIGSVAADLLDPLPADTSCEYYLTELAKDGALTGGSTCSGMPQQTRLEVPRIAQAWLTRAELVTILVAVLSAPPSPTSELNGPRFDGSQPAPRPIPVPVRPRR
jgi:hypothetical protein